MKRLINPLPAGYMPVYKDDLLILQDEVYKQLGSLMTEYTKTAGMVVSGMEATDNGGGNVTIAAGFCFLDGDFYEFPGYTGAYPIFVGKGTTVVATKVFKNGSTQNVYNTKVTNTFGTVPAGQSIFFNFDTKLRALNVAAYGIQTLETPWVDLGSVYLKYRRDGIGNVHLQGMIGVGGSANNLILPAGFRPTATLTFKKFSYDADGGGAGIPTNLDARDISVDTTTGVISSAWITGAGTKRQHIVDGISFRTDVLI